MHIAVVPALFMYLGTLALAETVYGDRLMITRWFALAFLLVVAASCWYSATSLRIRNSTTTVLVYLSLTFLTVIAAENASFSGLKWVSHAAMILIFLVFLWQSVAVKQVNQALNVLKVVVGMLIVVSWLIPVSPTRGSSIVLFHGVLGNSNAMGQVAAVGGLLFLHSFLIGKTGWFRRAEVVMICAAAWLVWSSGSRSSMVASITGLVLLNYFYCGKRRGKVFWVTLLILGSSLVMPQPPIGIRHFILRGGTETNIFSGQLFRTRASVWTAAWEGFQKRPFLGWGFGADDDIPKQWEPKLTAIGTVPRDSVNDTLIVLESAGVMGLIAYILLVILSIKQIPTRREQFLLRKIHAPPVVSRESTFSAYHNHAITFVIAVSLLVAVQFHNTALSTGNFVSVALWLCVALAGALRSKALAYESGMRRYRELLRFIRQTKT